MIHAPSGYFFGLVNSRVPLEILEGLYFASYVRPRIRKYNIALAPYGVLTRKIDGFFYISGIGLIQVHGTENNEPYIILACFQ